MTKKVFPLGLVKMEVEQKQNPDDQGPIKIELTAVGKEAKQAITKPAKPFDPALIAADDGRRGSRAGAGAQPRRRSSGQSGGLGSRSVEAEPGWPDPESRPKSRRRSASTRRAGGARSRTAATGSVGGDDGGCRGARSPRGRPARRGCWRTAGPRSAAAPAAALRAGAWPPGCGVLARVLAGPLAAASLTALALGVAADAGAACARRHPGRSRVGLSPAEGLKRAFGGQAALQVGEGAAEGRRWCRRWSG